MSMEPPIVISEHPNLSLDLLAHLRDCDLYSSRFGAPDELLLHSGGPTSDLSKRSLLMGPSRMRFIVKQPQEPLEPTEKSPLLGDIDLLSKPAPMIIEIEAWDNAWIPHDQVCGTDFADALRKLEPYLPEASGVTFQPGGLAGLLTYDMVRYTEPLRLHSTPEPGSILMILYRVDRWVVHDREDSTIKIESSIVDDEWVAAVRVEIEQGVPACNTLPQPTSRIPQTESDVEHAEKVRKTQSAIRKGVLYQLNYGRIWSQEVDNPWEVFQRLNRDNPAPLSAWLFSPDLEFAIASSSPELLLKQEGSTVSTRPIKGTRPRGDDAEHDANLRGELVGSRKEISEHLMLVDLERNDLGRICKPGSIEWKRWRIESYPHVQHMVSEITGELSQGMDGFDALQSVFPGGSITGCPKTATIAAIDELEGTPRRAWTGSIGYIDPRIHQSQWNILIRTMEAHHRHDSWFATVQAGGGLVIGSDPFSEVEEAKWKAQAICKAAWNYSPASKTIHSPRGSNSVSIHPIPPVTQSIQRLIEGQDTDLVPASKPHTAEPIRWYPGLELPNTTTSRVLFVDNLDSFSWNIVHALSTLEAEVVIVPGRQISPPPKKLIEDLKPTHIVLGPGPGRPEQSPLTMQFAKSAIQGKTPPLLGICLGHQAIGLAAGWTLAPTEYGAVHGVPDGIQSGDLLQIMTRYHSLALTPNNDILRVTATDSATNKLVMAIQHPEWPVSGVQYHPESAGSVGGLSILADFLSQ
jgi:anthranilate synthase/aminodeoxychorismate synthase-like glutamine amidotransferase